jgi:hypothetical protein
MSSAEVATQGVVRWEDPPPPAPTARGGAQTPWAIVAWELRQQRDRWAVVYEGNPNPKLAMRINQGLSPWFRPARAFETTQRFRDGQVTIYARFVGGGE